MGDQPGHEFRGNQYSGGGGTASVLKDAQSKTGGVKVRLYGSQQAQTAAGTPWGPQHGSVTFKTHDLKLAHEAAKTYADKGGKAFAAKWKAAKDVSKVVERAAGKGSPYTRADKTRAAEMVGRGMHPSAALEHAMRERDTRAAPRESYKAGVKDAGITTGHEHTGLSDFHKGKK